MKGKIARYLSFRGYGFISTEDREKDIFFHMSNYPPRQMPKQGQEIEFEINDTPKGPEAVKIRVLTGEEEDTVEEEVEEAEEAEPVEETEEVEPVEEEKPEGNLDQLSGIGPKYRELLEKSQINSCEDLANYTPEVLLTNLLSINEEENITKRPPNLDKVQDWVKQAKEFSK